MKLKLKKLDSVVSTNNEAIKLIKKKKIQPTIIIAKTQKKGRGTMGKNWISKKGNFFATIFFALNSKKIKFQEFSLLNPIIIKNILAKYSKYKINIKWPNDLMIKNKKICGILQETIEARSISYLIIGIGINTLIAPKNKNFTSICLQKSSNRIIKNDQILKDIKKSYEKLISDISKYKMADVKNKLQKIK